MRAFLMTVIVDLAKELGHSNEQLGVAHRRIRQLESDNARLIHEIADSVGPPMEVPS